MKKLIAFIALMFTANMSFADEKTYYIIGIPDHYDTGEPTTFHKSFTEFLFNLKNDDFLDIVSNVDTSSIVKLKVPKKLSSSKTGKRRFFDRKLRYYKNHLENSISQPSKRPPDLRRVFDYANMIKRINTNNYEKYKVILYGDLSLLEENKNDNFYKTNFENFSIIIENESSHYFDTTKRERYIQDISVFIFTSQGTNTSNNFKEKIFIEQYICKQGGHLEQYSIGITGIEAIPKLPTQYKYSNQCKDETKLEKKSDSKIKKSILAKDIFTVPVDPNTPPPNSSSGYIKIGLRWRYDSCKMKDKDCDLDLRVRPSKFEPEIFYKNKESSQYGWFKKTGADHLSLQPFTFSTASLR